MTAMETELLYTIHVLMAALKRFETPESDSPRLMLDAIIKQKALNLANEVLEKSDKPVKHPVYWIVSRTGQGPKHVQTDYTVYTCEPPLATEGKITRCYSYE